MTWAAWFYVWLVWVSFAVVMWIASDEARGAPLPSPIDIQEAERLDQREVDAVALIVKDFLSDAGVPIKGDYRFPAYRTRLIGFHGLSFDATAVVNSERPEDCQTVDLAHELSHLMLGAEYGLTPTQSEGYATAIDDMMKRALFVPNC